MKSWINKIFIGCEIILLLVIIVCVARFFSTTHTYVLKPNAEGSMTKKKPDDEYKTFTSEQLKGSVVMFAKSADGTATPTVQKKSEVKPQASLPDSSEIRAIYMSSWVASTTQKRNELISFVDRSPVINAIVIDLKDETGVISVPVPKDSPLYPDAGENKLVRIQDIQDLITTLHGKGIYVIGRIAVFQDNIYTKNHPESAIKNSSTGAVWKDRKNVSWIDPGYQPTWDYVVNIAKLGKSYGFDEINFDYVRYPTETSSAYTLVYPSTKDQTKKDVIENFFKYINKELDASGITTSVDIFGLLTTEDDIGIGQNLSIALDNFDYVSPMIYPSHYTSGSVGIQDPESRPFETIMRVMQGAYSKSELNRHHFKKIRPWIQDFSLKKTYGVTEVVDQLRALSTHGTKGFMVWSPNNVYTEKAYDKYGEELLTTQD